MGYNRLRVDHGKSDRSEEPKRLDSHPRRRYVLQYCRNAPEPLISVEELAAAVQRYESRMGEATVPEDCQLIAIDLHHAHLPKLARREFLEYDPTETLVTVFKN